MKTVTDILQLRSEPGPIVLAAGFFDGLHKGHSSVVEKALARAKALRGKTWVLTFDPHPLRVLAPEQAPPLLTSNRHKLNMLSAMNVEGCVLMPFTRRLALLEPKAFADKICASVPPLAEIVVGSNWRFGHKGSGDPVLLAKLLKGSKLKVSIVKPVSHKGEVISSTRIRQEVSKGRIEEVSAMLGRPFSVLGTVVKGRTIGRELGFPTANLDCHNEVLPPCGVYAVRARLDGRIIDGVLNLGFRPTFNRQRLGRPVMELHLLCEDCDLYGKYIEVFFIERLRNEKEFPSPEELRKQIARDVDAARTALSSKHARAMFR